MSPPGGTEGGAPPDAAAPVAPRAQEWAAVAVLALATVYATWPLASLRTTAGMRDTAFTNLVIERLQNALLYGGDWRSVGLAWPLPDSVTQADWVLGEAILAVPFRLVGLETFQVHNALVVLGLFATAWAGHRVARALLGPGPHTWIAGMAAGLNPVQLEHVAHVNLVHHEATVGGALALGAGLATRRPWLAALGGLLAVGGAHLGAYVGVQGVVVAAVTAAAALAARRGDARTWLAAAGGALVAGVTLLPVAAMYVAVAGRYEAWFDIHELSAESWDLANTLAPLRGTFHEAFVRPSRVPLLDPPNPGWYMLAIATLGVFVLRSPVPLRWAWIAVAASGVGAALLALGPEIVWRREGTGIPGPYRLFAAIPGMGGIRSPARWLAVAFAALGLPAAAGARWAGARVAEGWGRGAGMVVAGAISLTAMAEFVPTAAQTPLRAMALEPVYGALDALPAEGALFDEAIFGTKSGDCDAVHALRAAAYHGRPLVGGMFARKFDALRSVNAIVTRWASTDAVELFRAVGVTTIVDHGLLTDGQPDPSCAVQYGRHRVCTVPGPRRPPLPSLDAVTDVPHGPAVGVRFARGHVPTKRIQVSCQGVVTSHSVKVWRAIAALRHGTKEADPPLEVFLAAPCTARLSVSPDGAVALYARRGNADEPLSAWPPRSRRTIAESFRVLGLPAP